jgi:hypothetical protein
MSRESDQIVETLSTNFDQMRLNIQTHQEQPDSMEMAEPCILSNLLQLKFKKFFPLVREYLVFLKYYLEHDYVETECYDYNTEKSRIQILEECLVVLDKLDLIYNGNVEDYNGIIWDTSTIRKESVYLMSKCMERIVDTTVPTVVKNLSKNDRISFRNAQRALMSLCVDMGMK